MILGGDVGTINTTADDDSNQWMKIKICKMTKIKIWQRQMQRYVQQCKGNAWKIQKHEYLVTRRERNNLSHKDRTSKSNYW